MKLDPDLEKGLLRELSEVTLQLPVSSSELITSLKLTSDRDTTHKKICNLLEKFAIQKLITVRSLCKDGFNLLEVSHIEVSKINAMILEGTVNKNNIKDNLKRKHDDTIEKNNEMEDEKKKKEKREPKADIMVRIIIGSV